MYIHSIHFYKCTVCAGENLENSLSSGKHTGSGYLLLGIVLLLLLASIASSGRSFYCLVPHFPHLKVGIGK